MIGLENLEYRKLVVMEGIKTPFWEWLKYELDAIHASAIYDLTTIAATPDNLGMIAAAQERLKVVSLLRRKPFDLLGIPEPR